MSTSPRGMAALAASEGIVPAVYLDSVGVKTFGIGVTHWAVGEKQMAKFPVNMPSDLNAAIDEAVDWFDEVLVQYESGVRKYVKVPLYQYEFDALVHFAYNVGVPNLSRSKLLRKLNAGDYAGAGASGFHGWLRPTSLKGRRDFESDLFLEMNYAPGKKIPIYKTNGNYKLGKRVQVISKAEFIKMIDVRPDTRAAKLSLWDAILNLIGRL